MLVVFDFHPHAGHNVLFDGGQCDTVCVMCVVDVVMSVAIQPVDMISILVT